MPRYPRKNDRCCSADSPGQAMGDEVVAAQLAHGLASAAEKRNRPRGGTTTAAGESRWAANALQRQPDRIDIAPSVGNQVRRPVVEVEVAGTARFGADDQGVERTDEKCGAATTASTRSNWPHRVGTARTLDRRSFQRAAVIGILADGPTRAVSGRAGSRPVDPLSSESSCAHDGTRSYRQHRGTRVLSAD